MQRTITKMKNSLEEFKDRFEQTEENISELEDKTMEIIDAAEQKEKRVQKSEQSLRNLWDTIMWTNICMMGVPEGVERDKGTERIFEKNTGWKLLKCDERHEYRHPGNSTISM